MHAGPAARILRVLDLLGQQRQAQLHARQAYANVAGAHKGVEVRAADQQHVHIDQGLVFFRLRIVLDAGQLDLALAALNAKVALDGDEAKEIKLQAAHQARHLPVGAVQAQGQLAAGAGGHGQFGVALVGRVGRDLGQAVVHHRAVAGLAVDRQAQLVDCNRQALDAFKSDPLHRGLYAGPAARILGILDLLGQQRQAQLHTRQAHANVAPAHKGVQVGAANEQHVHIDFGLVDLGGLGIILDASELDLALAAFNAEVALNLREAEHVDLQATHQARHLASGAVQAQLQIAGQTGGHAQFGIAFVGSVGGAGRQAVVHHRAVFGLAVDLQA